jgi:hypothetical protein
LDSLCAGVSPLNDQVPVLSTVGAGSHNVTNGVTQREDEVGVVVEVVVVVVIIITNTNCN